MRLRTLVAVVAAGVAAVVSAGCASSDRSGSCDRSDHVEDALQDLEDLANEDTDLNNVDSKLERLGEDINEVMNTTDDENALQLSELDLRYDDLRSALEDLGNAEDLSQAGDAIDDALSQLGDAVENMSGATQEECTP